MEIRDISQSEFTITLKTMVDLLVRKQDTKQNKDQPVGKVLRKPAFYLRRLTSRTGDRYFIESILLHEYLRSPFPVGRKNMKPYLERIQTLPGIQIRHILFGQKARNAVCVELCLRNIGIEDVIKMLKYNDIVTVFPHSFNGLLHTPNPDKEPFANSFFEVLPAVTPG